MGPVDVIMEIICFLYFAAENFIMQQFLLMKQVEEKNNEKDLEGKIKD